MSNKCKICNRKLRNWKSIQRGIGPTCERNYLDKLYKEKQISIEDILKTDKRKEKLNKMDNHRIKPSIPTMDITKC